MRLTSTSDYKEQGVKILVYGDAGIGKTVLCATAPSPIILSAESGLLSLAGQDIPVIELDSIDTLIEAHKWVVGSKEGQDYETICIDSLSDLAETLLSDLIGGTKDPRQAYGAMAHQMSSAIRQFRDIKRRHVYFTAKIKRLEDSDGIVTFVPSAPGQVLLQNLPFFFDELFVYRYKKGKGGKVRYLQTEGDTMFVAKDRSGKLAKTEKPNLTQIFKKIVGGQNGSTTTESND